MPTPDAKPWTRWWWMGSAVTLDEIARHLRAYRDAGLGGVEITPIYGVRGAEHLARPLLSPEWVEALRFTLEEARRLALGVDVTLGSGWPYGGPHVDADHAPRRLALTSDAGRTTWAAQPTGQQVKRAAPGGAGNVMCPYTPAAFDQFIAPYTAILSELPHRPRCAFYDSFEVFKADFAPDLPDTFAALHGYRFADHLDALAGRSDADTVARVRHDYRIALEACLVRGIRAWVDWCHSLGIQARYQAHGSPGNLLDLYALADIPETEVFGTSRFAFLDPGPHPEIVRASYPLVNKLASSAAHLTGKTRVSSETFTWLREHYHSRLIEMKAEADQLFHAGINHIFFHGSTYSPASEGFPGWQFYAATHCDIADPLWHDLPSLTSYIAFCQDLLQHARMPADIACYFPYHDIVSRPGPELLVQLSVHALPQWIEEMPWGRWAQWLWDRSYAFDFVSDALLPRLGEGARRTIIVPPSRHMPTATIEQLVRVAGQGMNLLTCGDLPESPPGLAGAMPDQAFFAARAQLAACSRRVDSLDELAAALASSNVWPCPATPVAGVRATRLDHEGRPHWFVTSFAAANVEAWLDLRISAPSCRLIDPVRRREGIAPVRDGRVFVQLAPGESLWVSLADNAADALPWNYLRVTGPALPLTGRCTLTALAGGPALPPPTDITRFGTWTTLSDVWRDFSGTARYELRFHFAGNPNEPHLLRFPGVGDSVRVTLNGTPLGTLWCNPFELDVTGLMRAGENTLLCEVTNLGANHIAALDRAGVAWKKFHDINFADIRYRPFDAAAWPPRPSGLLAAPELVPAAIFTPLPQTTQNQG